MTTTNWFRVDSDRRTVSAVTWQGRSFYAEFLTVKLAGIGLSTYVTMRWLGNPYWAGIVGLLSVVMGSWPG